MVVWLCFCGDAVVFLWWCGRVFAVLFVWWCPCGFVSVVVLLWREVLEKRVSR